MRRTYSYGFRQNAILAAHFQQKLTNKTYNKMVPSAENGDGEDKKGKGKAPNLNRLLKSRLQKLVDKTDEELVFVFSVYITLNIVHPAGVSSQRNSWNCPTRRIGRYTTRPSHDLNAWRTSSYVLLLEQVAYPLMITGAETYQAERIHLFS